MIGNPTRWQRVRQWWSTRPPLVPPPEPVAVQLATLRARHAALLAEHEALWAAIRELQREPIHATPAAPAPKRRARREQPVRSIREALEVRDLPAELTRDATGTVRGTLRGWAQLLRVSHATVHRHLHAAQQRGEIALHTGPLGTAVTPVRRRAA